MASRAASAGDEARDRRRGSCARGGGCKAGPPRARATCSSRSQRRCFSDPRPALLRRRRRARHDVPYCGTVTGERAHRDEGHEPLHDPRDRSDDGAVLHGAVRIQPQAYQAATPAWHVGDGVHFLMFIGGGGRLRGPDARRSGGAAHPGGASRWAGARRRPACAADRSRVPWGMDGFDPAEGHAARWWTTG